MLIFLWLSKLFPHRRYCNIFPFFHVLNGAQYRILNDNNINNTNNNNNNNNNDNNK